MISRSPLTRAYFGPRSVEPLFGLLVGASLLGGQFAACGGGDSAPLSDAASEASAEDAAPSSECGTEADFPLYGVQAGDARASVTGAGAELSNDVLTMSYGLDGAKWMPQRLLDRVTNTDLVRGGELFEFILDGGRVVRASDLTLAEAPTVHSVSASCSAAKHGERFSAKEIRATFSSSEFPVSVLWKATLRNGANYVRESVEVKATTAAFALRNMVTPKVNGAGVKRIGTVDGSPFTTKNFFFGREHPMAKSKLGVPGVTLGTWGPAAGDEYGVSNVKKTLTWNTGSSVSKAGTYQVLMQYTGGGFRTEITKVALLENGVEIAKDEHFGATGAVDTNNNYLLVVPAVIPGAIYTLTAEVRTDGPTVGGENSSGTVEISLADVVSYAFASFGRSTALGPGESMTERAVFGVSPEGQMRRGFLHYVERERTVPYRPFLHYNSWYDIGYFSQYSEDDALGVIEAYGKELKSSRGVTLDSFLFDDGWDDPKTLWSFHSGFPNGFTPLKDAAAKYGAAPGVWLSPWGGYGDPQKQRLEYGKTQGYETNDRGFALSGPKYFERFKTITLELVEKYGVNQFKFDGTGRATSYPGSKFSNDFDAAMEIIRLLREKKPDVFVNLTTGTWASPFWLLYADSIWRNGFDHEYIGVGSARQKWLTYRDASTYNNIVSKGPLFPISALMLHGVIFAKRARGTNANPNDRLDSDPEGDLRAEIRSYFGTGTHLQELYITPALMSATQWDDLAASAKWARERASVLRDTHWIGGSPDKLKVYGWASWSKAPATTTIGITRSQATLTLRNPSDAKQSIALNAKDAFELPDGAESKLLLTSPYKDQRVQTKEMNGSASVVFDLEPFEVLVFDGIAVQ